jgi:hypothetical protein
MKDEDKLIFEQKKKKKEKIKPKYIYLIPIILIILVGIGLSMTNHTNTNIVKFDVDKFLNATNNEDLKVNFNNNKSNETYYAFDYIDTYNNLSGSIQFSTDKKHDLTDDGNFLVGKGKKTHSTPYIDVTDHMSNSSSPTYECYSHDNGFIVYGSYKNWSFLFYGNPKSYDSTDGENARWLASNFFIQNK